MDEQDKLNKQNNQMGKKGSGTYLCIKCNREFEFVSSDPIERVSCPFCNSVSTTIISIKGYKNRICLI
jgi:DNA-directed RNA polymerase subunit RPC12/RpoP